MDTSVPATNGVPSQTESSAPSDPDGAASASSEMAEAKAPASSSPKRTLPLSQPDRFSDENGATVAREQALVATNQRSGVPLALAVPPTLIARWWRVLHPAKFWLSMAPLVLGAVLAWFEPAGNFSGIFHPIRLLGLGLAVLAIHAGANLLNEYYDVLRGVDGEHALGSSKVLQKGLLQPETVRRVGLVLLVAGAIVLLVLVLVSRAWGVLILGGLSVLLAYFYSATRYALGYFRLSELILGFVMGPAILLSSVQLQGARVSSLAIAVSLALGSLAAAGGLANNLRDLETDRAANKRTLVTSLGIQIGRTFYVALVLLPYLLIALMVFPQARPHGMLLVLVTLSGLFVVITGILRAETPAAMNVVVEQTLGLHRRFSLWLVIGYLASIAVVVLPGLLQF